MVGSYEGPDGTRRCKPAVPGATADNGDFLCLIKKYSPLAPGWDDKYDALVSVVDWLGIGR